MTTAATVETALSVAKSLRPLIEGEADTTDAELTMTKACVEAFSDTKLFHLMVPKDFGGLEADTDTILDVFEELCHQEGSIGWSQMANASATAYCAFLDPKIGAEMVADKPGSVFAGQFAPRGTAKRDDGGFRVAGSYGFGSGTAHASYIGGGGFVTDDDGTPEMLPAGFPAYLCWFATKDTVVMQDGWDVIGLRGTGSYDYTIPEQVIEEGRTFMLFDAQVNTGGPMLHIGPTGLAGLGHAGWGLGVAQRALDEIENIVRAGRSRMNGGALQDQQVFQRNFGEQSLALRSVRLLVHDAFGEIMSELSKGNPMTKAMNDDVFATVAYMTQICQDVTGFAYQAAGSQGLRNPSILQRCFRDMFTGGQHIYVDRKSYEDVAKGQLGIEG